MAAATALASLQAEARPIALYPSVPFVLDPYFIPARLVIPDPDTRPFVIDDDDDDDVIPPPPVVPVQPGVTDEIIERIEGAFVICARTPERYIIDCLSSSFRQIARSIPQRGDYSEARRALFRASNRLASVVRQNRDFAEPRIRLRLADSEVSDEDLLDRTLRPVEMEQVAAANASALAILEETETILLRSTENVERRASHYQRIATAVGSTKILLRS